MFIKTLKYEQEFEEALKSFNKAALYDPVWEPPQQKEKELVQYLKDICAFVTTSGKMKAKRLQQILQVCDFLRQIITSVVFVCVCFFLRRLIRNSWVHMGVVVIHQPAGKPLNWMRYHFRD